MAKWDTKVHQSRSGRVRTTRDIEIVEKGEISSRLSEAIAWIAEAEPSADGSPARLYCVVRVDGGEVTLETYDNAELRNRGPRSATLWLTEVEARLAQLADDDEDLFEAEAERVEQSILLNLQAVWDRSASSYHFAALHFGDADDPDKWNMIRETST